MYNPAMRLSLSTAPTVEPVSLSEAKLFARIDTALDNDYVESLVTVSRRMCEDYTRRSFISQTWVMYLDAFPCANFIEVPRAPLVSVTSVVTYDDSDNATTFASSNYYADTVTRPGRIVLRTTAVWPTVLRVANGIAITFVAGYDATPAGVPADIRHAILMTIAHLYENRGDEVSTLPPIAEMLLSPHKDWAF